MIPGKSEHASSIGMALASVLSIRLSMESEDEGLRELRGRLKSQVQWEYSSEPMFLLVATVLKLVARVSAQDESFVNWEFIGGVANRLSTRHKLWLSRVILQTIWRWMCVQGPTGVLGLNGIRFVCENFTTEGDQMPKILKTNLFLILAISLGLLVDFRDLYAPNNKCAAFPFFPLTPLIEL